MRFFQIPSRPTTQFQDLPADVVVLILSSLSYTEVSRLCNLCTNLKDAVGHLVAKGLTILRHKLKRRLKRAMAKGDQWRPRRMFLQWLKCELGMVKVAVIMYRADSQAWRFLCRFLGPLLDELTVALRSPTPALASAPPDLPFLDDFLSRFDDEIELHLFYSFASPPFEVKIVDLLSCCPAAEVSLTAELKCGRLLLSCRCEMGDLDDCSPEVGVRLHPSPNMKQRLLLKFLRRCVRRENRKFFFDGNQIREVVPGSWTRRARPSTGTDKGGNIFHYRSPRIGLPPEPHISCTISTELKALNKLPFVLYRVFKDSVPEAIGVNSAGNEAQKEENDCCYICSNLESDNTSFDLVARHPPSNDRINLKVVNGNISLTLNGSQIL